MSKKRRKFTTKLNKPNPEHKISELILRYIILLGLSFPGLILFYKIFTPLTVYPVYFILSLFYDAVLLTKTTILIEGLVPIEIIGACIAGSAYSLLLILNLSTPNINLSKRVNAILFSFLAFLILNILRIVVLSIMAISGSSFFNVAHELFWYGLSTLIVVLIWFSEVKLFDIKKIPLYSDLKTIYKLSHFSR